MSVPATLIRKSTQELIKRGTLPAIPTEPVPGLDPDLEWLIDIEPYAMPAYDGRVYQLNTIYTAAQTPHPTYPLYNQYQITYETNRRSDEELYAAVDAKEQFELNGAVPYQEQLDLLVEGQAMILKRMDKLKLDEFEEAVYTKILAHGDKKKIHKNRVKKLYDDISKGKTFDLDDGWN